MYKYILLAIVIASTSTNALAANEWLICNHPMGRIDVNSTTKEAYWANTKTEFYSLDGTPSDGKISINNMSGSKMTFSMKGGSILFDGNPIGKCELKNSR